MEDYRVTQTGDEIQEIFNQSPVDTSDISELKEAATSLDGRLEAVEGKIPSGASSENPLTDKQYVDSSIASASATFRGTYNEVTDIELTTEATHAEIGEALASVIDTADSNDYCFVQIPTADATPTEIESIERYKFVTGTGWEYEYTLNNSGFTADQWAAINSGITRGLVTKLADLPTNAELETLLNGKANAADVYTKSETYNKDELDSMITTPDVQYVSVTATAQTTSVTDVLPATGAADTIYRVGSWDGTQYNANSYSEYAWNGSVYVPLNVKNTGIATGSDFDNPTAAQRTLLTTVGAVLDGCDAVPTAGGVKPVQSGGVADYYGTYEDSSEWIRAITDSEGKLLCGIKIDGSIDWCIGVPQPVKNYVENSIVPSLLENIATAVNAEAQRAIGVEAQKVDKVEDKSLIDDDYITEVDSPEFVKAYTDSGDKMLFGIKEDGDVVFGVHVPSEIMAAIEASVKAVDDAKVDKEEGKSLIDEDYINETEGDGFIEMVKSDNDRVLLGIKDDGDVYFGKMPSLIQDTLDKMFPYHGGIYAYPARILTGKTYYWFRDVVFSGLKPIENFNVECTSSDYNYSKRTITFSTNSAGSYSLGFRVKDTYNQIVAQKTIALKAYNAPAEKLAQSEGIDVFFLGDSMIGNNYNLIGKEFQRMLSTDDAAGTDTTGAKLLAGLNVCPGKINLVGEMESHGSKYQYSYKLEDIFIHKREYPYGDEHATMSYFQQDHNPFYNPDSLEKDILDADGMNKRVDFVWYFTNACGEGKYPKLVYICIGANDPRPGKSTESIDADYPYFEQQRQRIVVLCKRIKAACDTIAGGESGTVIKVFNHQSHEPTVHFKMPYNRIATNLRYDYIYDGITNPENGISSYVDFVDCASHFDTVNGYSARSVNTNVRTTSSNDTTFVDTVHMNNVGAYNYADILIDDFLADSRFD